MSKIYELEEVLEQPEEAERKGFSIDDDATADWAVRKIKEEQKEYERLAIIASEQIAEINLKLRHVEEVAERKTAFLKECLAQYFQTVPHKATKTQESYKLLSGSLVMKLGSQKMVKNDAELVEFFRQNDMTEYIKTKEEPKWAEFKKNLSIVDGKVIDTTTGEVVDVVGVEEVPGTFDVKTV